MRKLAGIWIGYLCIVLLTACVRKDDPTAPGLDLKSEDVGEAELRLPALPDGFLAKRSTDTISDTTRAYFILTISGPGMTPRRHSWPLDSSARTVRVTEIPVGTRLFTGELELGGMVTYSDSVRAQIEKGKTAYVHLKLVGASTGDAQICVEIEGLPLPANCRPSIPSFPDISGCWTIYGADSGALDPLRLRILQRDSLLQADLLLPDGRRDTARGIISPSGWMSFGSDSSGDFYLAGQVDTSRLSLQGRFSHRNIPPYHTVSIFANRSGCSIDSIPRNDSIPVPVDSLTCWDADQTLGSPGRYLMLERNTHIYGLFRWTGYPDMPVHGSKTREAGTGLKVYLAGVLPPGLSRMSGRHDSVQYVGQLMPADRPTSIANGTVNGIELATGDLGQLGEWKAYISTCTVAERRAFLSAHRL